MFIISNKMIKMMFLFKIFVIIQTISILIINNETKIKEKYEIL